MRAMESVLSYPHWIFPEGNQIRYRCGGKPFRGIPSDRIWYQDYLAKMVDGKLRFYAREYGIENPDTGWCDNHCIFVRGIYLKNLSAVHIPSEQSGNEYTEWYAATPTSTAFSGYNTTSSGTISTGGYWRIINQ